jgi:hypothetical protein
MVMFFYLQISPRTERTTRGKGSTEQNTGFIGIGKKEHEMKLCKGKTEKSVVFAEYLLVFAQ